MNFTDQQIEEIEKLSALNYTVKNIAVYLNIRIVDLQNEFDIKESVFRYHYFRGPLVSQANIDIQVVNSAEKGNLTAIQRNDRSRVITNFINIRDSLLNSFSNPPSVKEIKNLPAHNENS